jgi:hypothetical protein
MLSLGYGECGQNGGKIYDTPAYASFSYDEARRGSAEKYCNALSSPLLGDVGNEKPTREGVAGDRLRLKTDATRQGI